MATMKLCSGRILGDYEVPYVIAEVNSSHNGNVEIAKKMIDAAVEAGCNCVKFQSWSAESLYSASYYKANPISKRIVSKFSLSSEDLKGLAEYCINKGIDFSSTPYSREEVDFLLDECKAPFVKVASMDLNNYNFLRYIAKKKAPIVLSTGMSTIEEVRNAVHVIEEVGNNQICLLHCISIYPPELNTIHLHNILGLREEFPQYPIGFSDHSHGVEMAVAATALGVALIEKHLTLDRTKIGMDNQMATEPDEMKQMVYCCLNTQIAMGNRERVVREAELEQIKKMRRSVIVTRDLPAGHILTIEDLDAKRPGTGITADKIDELVGKTLLINKEADTLLETNEYK
ncbi:N-acetylneuraminate synthase family protein [Bacteroides sp.]|uniref:N-acetylneuraminate synthase family protein n=1 Tax=Bacteroides sp. TaxID=29523 RepID=UPI002633EA74|nr:N-acetylneuraminate synthase family protein [Bacteroides sp.]